MKDETLDKYVDEVFTLIKEKVHPSAYLQAHSLMEQMSLVVGECYLILGYEITQCLLEHMAEVGKQK